MENEMERYLRRYAAWATGLREKYRSDLFFRTTTHIILLQAGFVVMLIIVFWLTLQYNNEQILNYIVTNIQQIVSHAAGPDSTTIPRSIGAIQATSAWYIFSGVIIFTTGFGLLLARFTLRPARDTLRYQKLFISNIAHELRTPLSTIKTSSEVALLDESVPQETRKVLLSTVDELDRVSSIINNLLSLDSFTRPERIQFEDVDLGRIVDDVLGKMRRLAEERNIKIIVKMDAHRVVWGNATALEQVVTNLLKNAIGYTPQDKNGLVTLSVRPDYQGMVMFSVSDNGIGIAQEDLFHIFEPFYRADTSRVRRVRKGGSGIGLTIVNEIVRVHHGKITIQSTPKRGTTVTVYLISGTPAEDTAINTAPAPIDGVRHSEVSMDFSRGRAPTPHKP
jgi:signal transduction histidine kinase